VRRGAAGVGAREQQQVGDEPAHPARGAQRGGGGLALLALELLLEQLEVGQHGGQRRAQLVRGVGDELALARERASVSARARRAREHRSSVRASSATSSSASGAGCAATGRACARSRARPRSAR
jgi:hypothetical protein